MTLPAILQEDAQLVAFAKPAGLPVVANRPDVPSLVAAARARYGPELSAVHRLDPEASGVVLCAKTKPALDFLSGQFQAKTARRTLHAVVVTDVGSAEPPPPESRDGAGLAAAFAVGLPLGPDSLVPGKARVYRRGGQPAETDFRVLETFGRFAWVECRPRSAYPQQVRAHLAAVGAPVLNDALYGDSGVRLLLSDFKRGYKGREEERALIAQLGLHATALSFVHPQSRAPVTVEAPLPREFEVALRSLRKYARPGRA